MEIEDSIRVIWEGKVIIIDHADEEAEDDDLSFDEVYSNGIYERRSA